MAVEFVAVNMAMMSSFQTPSSYNVISGFKTLVVFYLPTHYQYLISLFLDYINFNILSFLNKNKKMYDIRFP